MLSNKIDHSKLYTFSIVLGSSCNWNCPYCIQSPYNTYTKDTDVDSFCDKFINYLEENNLTNSIYRVVLWGGEPLLYYTTVKRLIERLTYLPTKAPLRIVSNGSLLTEENYKIFNEYKTHFALSYHDGQLEDSRWEQALKIEDLVVSSLVHHKRLSWNELYDKWQYLATTFGRYVPWYVFPIIPTETVPQDYWFTKEDIDIYFNNLYSYLPKLDNVFFNTAFHGMIYEFSSKGKEKNSKNYCINDTTIAIDLKGNKYLCHHDCSPQFITGNIFNKSKVFNIIPEHLTQPASYCNSCSAYNYCLGGCYRIVQKEVTCLYNKKMVELLNLIKSDYSNYFTPSYLDLIYEV